MNVVHILIPTDLPTFGLVVRSGVGTRDRERNRKQQLYASTFRCVKSCDYHAVWGLAHAIATELSAPPHQLVHLFEGHFGVAPCTLAPLFQRCALYL